VNRKLSIGIIIIVLAVSSLAVGIYWVTLSNNQIDTSWIANLTQYLDDAKPYPQLKVDYALNAYAINLLENGTSTFVNASNGNNFSSYLLSVMSRANNQLNDSVSNDFVTKLAQNDKIVYLRSRLGTNFTQAGTFVWDTYFVLEDNLNQGLKGTIFIEHDINNIRMWQIWAIKK
jgi:hypothetical protein